MRIRILHPDTSLLIHLEEYKRTRTAEGPLTEQEMEAISAGYDEELERIVPARIPILIEEIRSAERARARSHDQIKVAAEVEAEWGKAFRHLQDLIEAVSELTRRHRIRLNESPEEHIGDRHVARTVLAARAVQTALGIEILLRAGHAAAAWAQWRILHELAVVTRFVRKHGEAAAAAYLQHGIEQSYRTLKAIRTHHTVGVDSPLLTQMLENHDEWRKVLESPEWHGPGFGATYGWAAAALGRKRPTFADLERDVGMSVARPEYQRASHVIHSGVRGFLDHLPEDTADESRLPWAPHAGLLQEPLALTAKTLTVVTGGLVDVESPASDLVLLGAITHFRDEVLATIYPEYERPKDSTSQG